jgi:hypothetical protein
MSATVKLSNFNQNLWTADILLKFSSCKLWTERQAVGATLGASALAKALHDTIDSDSCFTCGIWRRVAELQDQQTGPCNYPKTLPLRQHPYVSSAHCPRAMSGHFNYTYICKHFTSPAPAVCSRLAFLTQTFDQNKLRRQSFQNAVHSSQQTDQPHHQVTCLCPSVETQTVCATRRRVKPI